MEVERIEKIEKEIEDMPDYLMRSFLEATDESMKFLSDGLKKQLKDINVEVKNKFEEMQSEWLKTFSILSISIGGLQARIEKLETEKNA